MASHSLRPQADPAGWSALSLLKLAAAILLSLAIAACAPRRPPVETPTAEPEQEPERPEQPSRLPPDETRNRVAVLVPLSGPNAALGQSILNAANLALFDTGGQRIRITAYDTSGGAAAAVNEALADANGLILGPLLAEDVRAVAPIARRADVPTVRLKVCRTTACDRASSSLFLSKALSIGTTPAFQVDVTSASRVTPAAFDKRSVVILNDTMFPPAGGGNVIRRFLERGGGLLVVTGDHTTWPQGEAAMLPGRLGAAHRLDVLLEIVPARMMRDHEPLTSLVLHDPQEIQVFRQRDRHLRYTERTDESVLDCETRVVANGLFVDCLQVASE